MKKYVFYALGEVMLVVIGILIAVQLGNWNSLRKERKEEQFLLQSLKEDFEKNLENLNADYEMNETNLNGLFRLLEIIREQNPSPDLDEINEILTGLNSWGTVDFNSGSIDDMKNSGKIQIIENEALRNRLSEWPSVAEDLHEEGEIMVNHYMNFVMPALAKIYPLVSTDKLNYYSELYSRPSLPKSKNKFDITDLYGLEIESLFYMHTANFDYVLKADLEAMEKVKTLLKLIEAGLKSE
jgi:uncharacterized protein YozE (UPF0346 family)